MSENYKFFQNTQCEYFPCHAVKNKENFNCLFCYCPLYFAEECGGNHCNAYGIKDCSNCLIPHSENGYDYIVDKIRQLNETRRYKPKPQE